MAFGAFDGVHTGHLYYLKAAKKLGGFLVVSIGRDRARWKLPRKYNLPEAERRALVEGLGIADRVVLGSTKKSLQRIAEVNPDVIALTCYHPVDGKLLQMELEKAGLKARVVLIKPYKPEIYDCVFGVKPIVKKAKRSVPCRKPHAVKRRK
ncbi:FAD synthase [uncultured archaeon]|nr:FAD synthase [uncultured archaeon]